MSTNQHQQITREMRVPTTDDRLGRSLEQRTCENCDRNQDGKCLASPSGLSWQEMIRMSPSVGGCGELKVKWRAK